MIIKYLLPTPIASFTCAIALALSTAISADMSLNPDASSVSLLEFTRIEGSVDSDGIALITIPLDSIETNIPIRNERMAEFLFETAKYPNATISANVPPGMLESGAHNGLLDAQLSLHGQTQDLSIPVNVHYASDKVVVSASPVHSTWMVASASYRIWPNCCTSRQPCRSRFR